MCLVLQGKLWVGGLQNKIGEISKLQYNWTPVLQQQFTRRRAIFAIQKWIANIQGESQVATDQLVGGLG